MDEYNSNTYPSMPVSQSSGDNAQTSTSIIPDITNQSVSEIKLETVKAVLEEKPLTARERQLKGLKPWKKGESGNKKGLPEGTIQGKPILNKRLKKAQMETVIDKIIDNAMSGSNASAITLLKLTGDLDNNAPTVNITQNTLQISEEVMELARMIAQQQNDLKQIENNNE